MKLIPVANINDIKAYVDEYVKAYNSKWVIKHIKDASEDYINKNK